LDRLEIQPCPIEAGQAWQNLIESQFNVQRRLADAKFIQAETFAELQDQHAAFIQMFNTTRHWAHRERTDDCLTPIAVLGGRLGRSVSYQQLQRVFRQLQFSRTVNQHGLVSVQRFFIYAERGLAQKRVTIWIYDDRLNIEYKRALLARYDCKVGRQQRQLTAVTNPQLYDTPFVSPQLEFFVLDDDQWLKVIQRPPFAPRKSKSGPFAEQLHLWSTGFILCLWLWGL
jgi:hypothetical protein